MQKLERDTIKKSVDFQKPDARRVYLRLKFDIPHVTLQWTSIDVTWRSQVIFRAWNEERLVIISGATVAEAWRLYYHRHAQNDI